MVKAGFSAKRKKLRSSLSGGLIISKLDAELLLERAKINPDLRAEQLSIDDWVRLVKVSKSTKEFIVKLTSSSMILFIISS
jgi:16S rRNA (adenine1518-N6/adenine1519-N6)-dimethyltransferase